jgi:polyhydroxyalkanoate synthesis regulator phasin
MLELLKKTVFAGIGAAITTKERVETMLQEMVEQGKLTREEASRMADKIARDGKEEFERTQKEISRNLSQMFSKSDVVSIDDFRKLELRVSILEEKEAARELSEISEQKQAPGQVETPPSPPPPTGSA